MEDGSTCLIAMIRDGMLYVGNVGDSRAIMSTRSGEAISLSQGNYTTHVAWTLLVSKTLLC